MAYQVRWTDNAVEDYRNVIRYLLAEWSVPVASAFESIVYDKLFRLSQQPYIGIASHKSPSIRSILLTKHNRLYYRINKDTIELLNIFDTRKNPDNKPY